MEATWLVPGGKEEREAKSEIDMQKEEGAAGREAPLREAAWKHGNVPEMTVAFIAACRGLWV